MTNPNTADLKNDRTPKETLADMDRAVAFLTAKGTFLPAKK